MNEEEIASQQMRTNDVVNTKAEVRYVGTTGEGVEQRTLSSCDGTTTKDKADDSRVTNTTPGVDEGFGTRVVFETSSNEEASLRDRGGQRVRWLYD